METENKKWLQVSLNGQASRGDTTRITYIRPPARPYAVVSVMAEAAEGDASGQVSGTGGVRGDAVLPPQTSSTFTTTGSAGQSNGNAAPDTIEDILKKEQALPNSTGPSRAGEAFPGGSTPPSIEVPIGVNIPPIDEMPPVGITPPEGSILGEGICLGRYSIGYISQIEYFLLQELNIRQSLLALANLRPDWAETIVPIAEGHFNDAERLSSAYYLIANTVYWPATVPGISSKALPEVELSRLYSAIRWLEGEYRVNAARISDPCLAALYLDLAAKKSAQARTLLAITGIVDEGSGEPPI